MTNSKSTKRALVSSVLAVFMCVAMLIGTTFAWFTDTASTSVNKIQAGTLDVALEMKENGNWVSAEGKNLNFVAKDGNKNILWEPGCTYNLPELRIVNNGNLALKYKVNITGINGDAKLNEVIDWTIGEVAQGTEQKLAAGENAEFTISGTMQKNAGNAYQGLSIDGISITVLATQDTVESDSNGTNYDAKAEYSTADFNKTAKLITGGTHTINEDLTIDGGKDTVDAIRVTDGDVTITGGNYSAIGTGGNSALRVDGGNVTIKGGNFFVGGDNNCIYGAGGNITIEGGTFKSETMYDGHYWVLNVKDYSGSVITLKGGKFYGFDPTDTKNNTAPNGMTEIVVADGYEVVKSGDYYCVCKTVDENGLSTDSDSVFANQDCSDILVGVTNGYLIQDASFKTDSTLLDFDTTYDSVVLSNATVVCNTLIEMTKENTVVLNDCDITIAEGGKLVNNTTDQPAQICFVGNVTINGEVVTSDNVKTIIQNYCAGNCIGFVY